MDRPIISLVPQAVSEDLLLALDHLKRAADTGEINVLAWIAIGPGGDYEIDVAGESQKEAAVVLRGLLPDLERELHKLRGK